jgi:hypothetical protein
MVKQICAQCQHSNPLENHFCGHCGASLDNYQIVPRQETSLTVAGHHLPAEQLKQIGQAAAVSLAALAAEAVLAWLRRRVGKMNASSLSTIQGPSASQVTRPIPVSERARSTGNMVTVFSQRVVRVWERGNLVSQLVERTIWRREE